MVIERITQGVLAGPAQRRIRYVRPVRLTKAEGLVAQVYEQMLRDFAFVPPLTVHSPVPEILAGVWCVTRESLVAGEVPRSHREAVASAVSSINACPFCVDIHTTMLAGAGEHATVGGLLSGDAAQVTDAKLRGLVDWARATRSPGAEILRHPPFEPHEAPLLIGTALGFHYINRMVNVFMFDGSPLRMPRGLGWLKNSMRRVGGRLIARPMLARTVSPGASLDLLLRAEPSADLAWTQANPYVQGAWSRMISATERAGRDVVSANVRALVAERLATWHGEDLGLSRSWVEEPLAALDEGAKPAGRLALLTALASHQVDSQVVESYQQTQPGDAALITTTAWSSLQATKRIATWLVVSAAPQSTTHEAGREPKSPEPRP